MILTYIATIAPLDPDDLVVCGSCDWEGGFNALNPIGDAILTPGNPSPAGRCPECGSLAYVPERDANGKRTSENSPSLDWMDRIIAAQAVYYGLPVNRFARAMNELAEAQELQEERL